MMLHQYIVESTNVYADVFINVLVLVTYQLTVIQSSLKIPSLKIGIR